MATTSRRVGDLLAEQLLATKLLVPAVGPEVLPRPRVDARLAEATRRRVTVVAAPAGFGKSTAVAAWVAGSALPIAWLTLDESDNELGDSSPTWWAPCAAAARRWAPQRSSSSRTRRCAGRRSSPRCSTTWRRRATRSSSCSTISKPCSRSRCSTRWPSCSSTSRPISIS